jgi:hypothetical protein
MLLWQICYSNDNDIFIVINALQINNYHFIILDMWLIESKFSSFFYRNPLGPLKLKKPFKKWTQCSLDSNEFLSKSLRHYVAETFLATHYIQKDYQRILFLKRYHFTARRAHQSCRFEFLVTFRLNTDSST